jgi:hypothetical protein
MIAHALIAILISIYAGVVVSCMFAHEDYWRAFKQRSERYLDAYRCDRALQTGRRNNA